MKNPYEALLQSGWGELAALGWQKLENNPHGDAQHWLDAIGQLPAGDGYAALDLAAPRLGRPAPEADHVREQLQRLHPWRKGPLELAGIHIDTEWRSDWKWERIEPRLNIEGHQVLDIGCGNGYFGLRMLAAGAQRVIGIDPTMVFVMQWLAMQKLAPGLENYVLPLGIEELPRDTGQFDSVFSMGVLYHRRDPVAHIKQLRELTRPGGQLLLETLILEGDGNQVLEPPGRYARMRNVHAIPTLAVLQQWLAQAGLPPGRVLDISKTTTEEQRSTDWMTFESLSECLDPQNDTLSIEGHPAPVRAALLVRVG